MAEDKYQEIWDLSRIDEGFGYKPAKNPPRRPPTSTENNKNGAGILSSGRSPKEDKSSKKNN